jgi:hypothetical protein
MLPLEPPPFVDDGRANAGEAADQHGLGGVEIFEGDFLVSSSV